MKTIQAWGWLAAGVLALGLNGIYQDGGAEWAHRAVNRVIDQVSAGTEAILALASGRADLFLSRTRMAAARVETKSCRFATAIERIQTKMVRQRTNLDRAEAISDREKAEFARLEAERTRIEAQVERIQFSPVAFYTVRTPTCPRVRVSVPRIRVPLVSVPQASVEITGAGPI